MEKPKTGETLTDFTNRIPRAYLVREQKPLSYVFVELNKPKKPEDE